MADGKWYTVLEHTPNGLYQVINSGFGEDEGSALKDLQNLHRVQKCDVLVVCTEDYWGVRVPSRGKKYTAAELAKLRHARRPSIQPLTGTQLALF